MGAIKIPDTGREQFELAMKIRDILTVYGRASPTMLQAALGAHVKPAEWRPVMQKLIDTKELELTMEMYNGKTYKVLELIK